MNPSLSVEQKLHSIYLSLKKFDPYIAEKYKSLVFNHLVRLMAKIEVSPKKNNTSNKIKTIDRGNIDLIKTAIKNLVDYL